MDTREILTRFKSGTLAREHAAALLTGSPLTAPAPEAAPPEPESTVASEPPARPERAPGADRYAVTAVHGRFPGADGLDAYWRSAIGGTRPAGAEQPRRLDGADAFDTCDALDGCDAFDAEFFGLGPDAAALLDVQERLLLETGWQTLESAGHTGARLDALTAADGEPRAVGVYVAHTEARACRGALPGRLSALLDLRGPSQCVDSGASSFLGALHLALGALRDGDCAAALVAAVDPAHGVGAVLVRPLAAALAAADTVHAVVRASAVAHAGRAAPSDADDRIAKRARDAAGLAATDIARCESPAGDAGAATGFTALARAVLQLTHGTFLPVPGGPDAAPWPRPRDPRGRELPRRAAVAVRGEHGTAAHVILEEHPLAGAGAPDATGRPELILMSAPTPRHLTATARLLADRLADASGPELQLAAIAKELRIGRATMDCRLAVTVDRVDELADALREFAAGADAARVRHADLRGRTGEAPLAEELDETARYLTALWRGRRLEALSRLWLAGADVTRGEAHAPCAPVALPGTAMLRRPAGESGGSAR